jgi:hypothetical protein
MAQVAIAKTAQRHKYSTKTKMQRKWLWQREHNDTNTAQVAIAKTAQRHKYSTKTKMQRKWHGKESTMTQIQHKWL